MVFRTWPYPTSINIVLTMVFTTKEDLNYLNYLTILRI